MIELRHESAVYEIQPRFGKTSSHGSGPRRYSTVVLRGTRPHIACRGVATILAACILTACATAQRTASLECGAGGAALGYLLCKLDGGDDRKCMTIAAATGIGGAAICYAYAANLEKRRQALAGKENDLDARLRYVRAVNEDSENFNQQLKAKVAKVTEHTDNLVAQMRQQKISQQQLAKERQGLDTEISSANEQLAAARIALDDMKQFQAGQTQRSTELDVEIARQQRLLDETKQQTLVLARQRQRVG